MFSPSLLLQKLKTRLTFNTLIKNLSITLAETIITKGLNFVMILMLTRTLGPQDYGKYSFIFVIVATCSALFDFGMENTAVRFAARDKSRTDRIFGFYLLSKLGILLALVLFFVLLGPWMFSLFGKSEMSHYLPYLIFGLIGESLFFVNDTYLQARQDFRLRAMLNILRYTLSMVYIWVLFTANFFVLEYIFLVYLIPLVFCLLFIGNYVSFLRVFLRRRLGSIALLNEILRYEKWMMVYSIANNLLGRIDFFMLAFWVSYSQMGIYNAAFQLCAVVSFVPFVLSKVLLPALSELEDEEIFRKTNAIARTTNLVAILAAALIPWTGVVVPLLLGAEYTAANTILQVLLLAVVIMLISMPYEQALYSLGKPKMLCWVRYGQLFGTILLNLLTIPGYGIMAAAINTLIGRFLYLIFVKKYYRDCEQRESRQISEPMRMELS